MNAKKLILIAVGMFLVLAIGGGVMWYMNMPHTAEAQFAVAERMEKVLRGDALTKTAKELQPAIDAACEAYRKVGKDYGKSAKEAEGLKRVFSLQDFFKDEGKAMGALEELIKEYPEEENAGFGLQEQARLLRKSGKVLAGGKPADQLPPEALEKFKQAVEKLGEFRKKFETSKDADSALMEIGRIWNDDIVDPRVRAIETFEQLIKDYPNSDHKPEAMYRLGQLYEYARDNERALRLYTDLIENYPKGEWYEKALFARAKLLADKMEQPKDAAKDFEKFAKEFPESPMSGQAQGGARESKAKGAEKDGDDYGRSRYGGAIPYDTLRDKPIPPSQMFKDFIKLKLDAQKYELDVTLAPGESRISVKGTLELVNRGEDKNEFMLMLANGFEVKSLTVNGEVAEVNYGQEVIRIKVPTMLKKDATAKLAFEYTGQFAEPVPEMPSMPTKFGPKKSPTTAPGTEGGTGPTTGPATAPASAPALVKSKYPYNPQLALGEFGYGLSGGAWYPITLIGDVFDAKVTMHTPGGIEAVGNGALDKRLSGVKGGAAGEFVFTTHNPVFGLYFAYGPYTVQEKKVGEVMYYTYFRPENVSKHDAYVTVAARILDFYSGKFVVFPYEKLAIVEVPLPPFLGGVGPASLMFLHENMVKMKDPPETLLAHELAHQWFGNLLPINLADDGYHQWLSEGFATYCDALYTEKQDGPKALARHMQKYGQLYFQFTSMMTKGKASIRDTPMGGALYRPVVYEKGAYTLHMLRKVMGDEKFFKLMAEFVTENRNKGTTVDAFRKMASAVHGKDLSWFFAQWFDQSSFARWAIGKVVVEADEKGGSAFKIGFEVTQPDDLLQTPLDIAVIGEGGERQVFADQMIDKKEQTFGFTVQFKPVKIILDEDFWVLRHPGSGNIWEAKAAVTTMPKTTTP